MSMLIREPARKTLEPFDECRRQHLAAVRARLSGERCRSPEHLLPAPHGRRVVAPVDLGVSRYRRDGVRVGDGDEVPSSAPEVNRRMTAEGSIRSPFEPRCAGQDIAEVGDAGHPGGEDLGDVRVGVGAPGDPAAAKRCQHAEIQAAIAGTRRPDHRPRSLGNRQSDWRGWFLPCVASGRARSGVASWSVWVTSRPGVHAARPLREACKPRRRTPMSWNFGLRSIPM